MKRLLIFLVFILCVNGVGGLEISSQSCDTNGEFLLTLEAENKNITYTNQIEIKVDNKIMEGTWDINFIKKDPPDRRRQWANFVSDEAQITDGGNKIIKIKYPLEYEGVKVYEEMQDVLECPEFLFSCALLNVEINECFTEDNVFYGYFILKGFEQSVNEGLSLENNLDFGLFTEDIYEDIENKLTTRGSKPKKAEVKQQEGDKYVMIFEFPNENFASRFRVGMKNIDQCLVSKYDKYHLKLSDVKDCTIKEESVIEPEIIVEEPIVEAVPESIVIEDAVFEEVKRDNSDLILALVLALIVVIGFAVLYKIRKI